MSLSEKIIDEWDATADDVSPSVDNPKVAPSPPPPPPVVPAPAQERPSAASERAKAAYDALQPQRAMEPPFSDAAEPFIAAKDIDPLRIAELEALTPEVHLVSPDLGDIFLVDKHTGIERTELTFSEAATLRQLVDQFPGARVVTLRPAKPAPAVAEGWDS